MHIPKPTTTSSELSVVVLPLPHKTAQTSRYSCVPAVSLAPSSHPTPAAESAAARRRDRTDGRETTWVSNPSRCRRPRRPAAAAASAILRRRASALTVRKSPGVVGARRVRRWDPMRARCGEGLGAARWRGRGCRGAQARCVRRTMWWR